MSTYNIREKFSYVIEKQTIDYVRNYNFNSATITEIPLTMANSDSEIPITVDMTTTVPWIFIADDVTGADLRYPSGNVVLEPSASKTVIVSIDLPKEIEDIPESVLYPNISLQLRSGSFPIFTTATSRNNTPKNVIVSENDIYTLSIGETVVVNIAVYDSNGESDLSANVTWKSNNMSIVQVEEPQNTQADYNPYTPRTVKGISPGETTVTVSTDDGKTTDITFRVRPSNTSSTTSNTSSSGGDDSSRTPQA